MKKLHSKSVTERNDLQNLPPEELPPASSSNAARQVRSRLNITFPVDWQDLHLAKPVHDDEREQGEERQGD